MAKARRSQPEDVTCDEIANILAMRAPDVCKEKAMKCGVLMEFDPDKRNGFVDKASMELWAPVMLEMLRINRTGIFNATTLQNGLEMFDRNFGHAMRKPSHECIRSETFKGEHMWRQALIFKKYFQGLARIKRNSSSGSRHQDWLKQLLSVLQEEEPSVGRSSSWITESPTPRQNCPEKRSSSGHRPRPTVDVPQTPKATAYRTLRYIGSDPTEASSPAVTPKSPYASDCQSPRSAVQFDSPMSVSDMPPKARKLSVSPHDGLF